MLFPYFSSYIYLILTIHSYEPCCILYLFYYCLVPCPEITWLPVNITVLPGDVSNFSCMAFSFGDLKYEWKRKGFTGLPSEATTSLKLHKQNIMAYSMFSINKTGVTYEGWYCCVVTNECGDAEECAWLEVNSESLLVTSYVHIYLHIGQGHSKVFTTG